MAKKPRVTIASVSARLDALERQERGFASATMIRQLDQHLKERELHAVYALIHKEMERIRADLLSELSYQTVHVDVRHTRDGKEV